MDGALAIAQGKIGNALQFDGSGVHIRVADPEAFVANADFTWCAWINTSNPGGGILAKTSPDPGSDVQGAKTLFLDGGLLVFDVGWVGAVEGVTPVADGRWHYVSVTVTLGGAADTIQFYVDGALDAQGQLNVDQFPEEGFPIHIGLDPRVPGEPISVPFTGLIDEVAIYDRALSENEIANNAASTAGPALAVGPKESWQPCGLGGKRTSPGSTRVQVWTHLDTCGALEGRVAIWDERTVKHPSDSPIDQLGDPTP
ncbi:MAG: hypothetical protein KatS3mg115_0001 [Candidatus Poribacteria bacterium]|nr:MAG: hypothetical protein KatS3mg115_0001 [Candidatus Poribacteria bacterium]